MEIGEGGKGLFFQDVAEEGEEGASRKINRVAGKCHSAKDSATSSPSSACTVQLSLGRASDH